MATSPKPAPAARAGFTPDLIPSHLVCGGVKGAVARFSLDVVPCGSQLNAYDASDVPVHVGATGKFAVLNQFAD
ncbi:hypothetical protein OG558_27675 [Kribbella sp. NBC_01510]|uniref:hypothetical protein n=1 Tax=Kribbella sp. NBC_01510 TaxID=2903581 RepID=UPI00386592B7